MIKLMNKTKYLIFFISASFFKVYIIYNIISLKRF